MKYFDTDKKTAVIFCGAEIENYDFLKRIDFTSMYIICADSVLRHAKALKLEPNLVVGDHDSWCGEYPESAERIECKPEKDDTDAGLCINGAIEREFNKILLLGATGGRLDHEFSHYCLMANALERGVRITMIDENNEIWLENKPFELSRAEVDRDGKRYVSFFSYGGDVQNFSVHGLKYTAENINLKCSAAVASSNEFDGGDTAKIDFSDGMVLVMICKDPSD